MLPHQDAAGFRQPAPLQYLGEAMRHASRD